MDVLVLRLIHIGAGAFWVGAVFTFFLFVQPAAVAVGPDATKFTYQLLHHRRLPIWIFASGVVTVLAGLWLLVITSNGLDPEILFSASRLGYTVGGCGGNRDARDRRPLRPAAHPHDRAHDRHAHRRGPPPDAG